MTLKWLFKWKTFFMVFFSHTTFWSCLPLLPLLPVSLHLSPTQLFALCSLSPPSLLKNYPPKIRQTTNPGRQKCYNETKNPPQTLSPSCGFVLAGYSCARGLALECGWSTQCHNSGEKWISLCQQVSVAHSFSVRSGTPCLLPCLSPGPSSGFIYFVWMDVCLHALKCIACISGGHGDQNGLNILQLELQVLVSHQMDAKKWAWVLWKGSKHS